jgi:hypothetical protein
MAVAPPFTAVVSGVVFHDVNANGNQDAGDTGLAGAAVTAYQLLGSTYQQVAAAVSDAQGNYTLTWNSVISPAEVQVSCDALAGMQLTTPSPAALELGNDAVTATVNFGQVEARQCFYPVSVWVYEICWIPQWGLTITYKDHDGSPYFRCYYPGTTFADYQFFFNNPGPGHLIWAFGYYYRPYVAVPLGT